MNKAPRNLIVAIVFLLIAVVALNSVKGPTGLNLGGATPEKLTVGTFEKIAREKGIDTAEWQGDTITGKKKDGTPYSVLAYDKESNAGAGLQRSLLDAGVDLEIKPPPISQGIFSMLAFLIGPILLAVLFYVFIIRPAQSGGNQAMSFGKSRARRFNETGTKVTFDDVAGIEEAKQELFEVVDFLRNTKKYVALGAKIPKGILLTGPPGVGKTHLARAIAGEAGVPFFHISGSDFVEMFVGVGAARVRDLFEHAKAHRPCLIFVDEIDAVGRQRGAGLGGGHDEREQTLNQLLVEMDGFEVNSGVIMIAATNRPDVLDPALLRPGRFDRQVVIDRPDVKGRELILKIHSKGKPLAPEVKLQIIAKRTPGFTGADLANAMNESALLAARRNRTKIEMDDVEEALDRVMAGPQRKSRVIDPKEREAIAYHEAGHAIVGELLEHCDPIHKVTILPRGMSLGSTWSLPDEETFMESEKDLLDDISMSLGGRVAEEIVYGTMYTGAFGDLQRVTRVARAMVCEYGMSEKLGTLALGRRSKNPFLGRDAFEDRDYSEDVAKEIDDEVRRIVNQCYVRAKDILTTHREQLDNVVQVLLERETIGREEFLAIMEGRPLPEMVSEDEPPTGTTADVPEDAKSSNRVPAPPKFEPGPA